MLGARGLSSPRNVALARQSTRNSPSAASGIDTESAPNDTSPGGR